MFTLTRQLMSFYMEQAMKHAIRTLGFVMLMGLAGAAAASAQVTETIEFQTTFPFTVGNTTFPAGSFSVKPADDTDQTVMELSNGTTTALIVVEPQSADVNDRVKDEVVFNKYGDQYVLSQIWDAADQTGVRTETSVAEKRQAKKLGTPTRESVTASRRTRSGS
jgi:hypothetical protein